MDLRPDAYAAMARHYDLHGWDWYVATYGERLVGLLAEHGLNPPATILDAGCGTGSLALKLVEKGYQVTGVDLSSAMLDTARSKDRDHRVDWRVGDVTALAIDATFDAVVSVADVLNHLPRLEDWEDAFRSIHRHLRPGGHLIVDVMTSAGLAELDQQSVQEKGGRTLILSIIWDAQARRSTLKVVSFARSAKDPELFERDEATISEWGQPVVAVLEAAHRAGFASVERVWGTSPDGEADQRLTVVARR